MSVTDPHDANEIAFWKYLPEWERLEFYLKPNMTYPEYLAERLAGKIEGPSKEEMRDALLNPPHSTDDSPYDNETVEQIAQHLHN
jgi:hypothetical protein